MPYTITSLSLTVSDDIKILQQIAKSVTEIIGYKPFHATRLTTCAMELARNVIEHGRGGYARLSLHEPRGGDVVLRMNFADQGDGIDDPQAVLSGHDDARASGPGMGLGLAGVQRMADDFEIDTGSSGTHVRADFTAPIETSDMADCAEIAGNRCDEILMRESNSDRRIRQLETELSARDLAINEVHHRTANNLTMISSLIRLEQRRATEGETSDVLASLGIRVEAMARTHKLLQTGEAETVGARAYLQQISALAVTFNRTDLTVAVDVEGDDTPIPARLALDLGLITGELITNAFKHAFEGRSTGQITIGLTTDGEMIHYRFSDNGKGLEDGQQPERSGSLGWRMIRATVSGNLGKLHVDGSNGMRVDMSFPIAS